MADEGGRVSATVFDADAHRRRENRRLRERNEFLETERVRLERLLGQALNVAVGGTNVTPGALLDVLDDLDRRVQRDTRHETIDEATMLFLLGPAPELDQHGRPRLRLIEGAA